jgi:two-component system, OmpR family, response regulator
MSGAPDRILLVDDDPAIRAVTEATLRVIGGFDVTSAPGGERAIDICREQGFDLLLIDVMMPHIDGPATIRAMRSEDLLDSMPFVFLTAKVDSESRDALLSLGAARVIAKPFDPAELVEQIRSVMGRRN